MKAHWEALAAVAVTKESCIAIDAIQARVVALEKALEAVMHDCSCSMSPDVEEYALAVLKGHPC